MERLPLSLTAAAAFDTFKSATSSRHMKNPELEPFTLSWVWNGQAGKQTALRVT